MLITRNFARITFTVDADGIPRDFHVAETSDEAFARRVLATHEQITFKPALLNGEPTVVRASVGYLYYHYERGYRTTGYRSPYF